MKAAFCLVCAHVRRPSLPSMPAIPKRLRRPRKPAPTGPGAQVATPGPGPVPAPKRSRPQLPVPVPVIVVGVLVLIGIVLLLRTCGSDDEQEVRQTVERFGKASRDKDYQTLCDDLFSTAIVENLRSSGQPCEVALRTALEDVQNPTVEVRSVKVDGKKATAEVDSKAAGQRPSQDKVQLLKEDDGWRIASLADDAPSGPAP
jgi:hypothetical protein